MGDRGCVAGDGGVRVGVFICHCGGNIADVVDVGRVASRAAALPHVAHATTYQFVCSDPGQALIERAIVDQRLNRVVVAACSPSLHELTFRRTIARAGLNPYLFEHVNLREQVSWVIEDRAAATEKAFRLVRAAVARCARLDALEKRKIPIRRTALVVGGGVSGLVAARDIARRGMEVVLVERSPFLGGRMAQLDRLFPGGERSRELLGGLAREVMSHPRIRVLTGAEVSGASGFVGDFLVRIRQTPRGADARLADAAAAIAACPEERSDEFQHGLSRRKAIYTLYDGCEPPGPAIDWDACTKCGRCVAASGGAGISLDGAPCDIEVRCGVIVLATGFDPYEPRAGEYGWKERPGVVTMPQLLRMLDPAGPTGGAIARNGTPVRSVAFIHCVGSRQHEGVHPPQPDGKVNDHCSRVCCTAIAHAANELIDRFPGVRVYDLHEDIRTYGSGHERLYTEALRKGVVFIRFDPRSPPAVGPDPRGAAPLLVTCRDRLTEDREIEVPVDLVVLGTGIMPRDLSKLVDIFRCARGPDRFLLEVHPKLRPVELAVFGVYLAGTVQGPMDIGESTAAAAAAASKAAALMAQGYVELDPFVAHVDDRRCSGCQTCLYGCPYEAIARDEEKGVAVVNEALCMGCGSCVATCPSDAIKQIGFTDDQIAAELAALLARGAPAPAGAA